MGSKPTKPTRKETLKGSSIHLRGDSDKSEPVGRPHAATLPTHTNPISSSSSPNHHNPPSSRGSTIVSSSSSPPSKEDPKGKPKTSTVSTASGVKGGKEDTSSFSVKKLEELFLKYTDPDDTEQIGPDGLTRLFQALEVDPEDVVTLVLAWHLNAAVMGYFSKPEFMKGFQKLNVDTIPKIKASMKSMREELEDPVRCKEIYKYAFGFAKEKNQRYLEISTAQAMLSLILGEKTPHVTSFLRFLNEQGSYKVLNIDQWTSFLEFSRTINEDLLNYDATSAWPVMLDEYVEWRQKELGIVPEEDPEKNSYY